MRPLFVTVLGADFVAALGAGNSSAVPQPKGIALVLQGLRSLENERSLEDEPDSPVSSISDDGVVESTQDAWRQATDSNLDATVAARYKTLFQAFDDKFGHVVRGSDFARLLDKVVRIPESPDNLPNLRGETEKWETETHAGKISFAKKSVFRQEDENHGCDVEGRDIAGLTKKYMWQNDQGQVDVHKVAPAEGLEAYLKR